MPTYALTDSFETLATWHLPETPERELPGVLRYGPRWTEVEFHGSFQPLDGDITAEANAISYPMLHGVTRDGELATVLNAQRNSMNMTMGSAGLLQQHETVVSRRLFLGAHLVADHKFFGMDFRVPGLEAWRDETAVERQMADNPEGTGRTWAFLIALRSPEVIRVESINANLTFQYRIGSNPGYASLSAAASAWVCIVPDEPQTLDWYLTQNGKLEAMLAFLAGTPMSADRIDTPSHVPGRDISVLVTLGNKSYCAYRAPHEFFQTRRALGNNMIAVTNKWFQDYSKVDLASQVALGVMATEQHWLNIEFLLLMQVLEGFHRGLLDGTYMAPDSYRAIEAALVGAIPPGVADDHRASLRSRMHYGNEWSLKRRIQDLLSRLSVEIRQAILGADGRVSQRWIDTRNYFTHWGEELRPNVLGAEQLFHANVRLRHLVRALFLDLMGVSHDSILQGLSGSHSASQHLMQINASNRHRSA